MYVDLGDRLDEPEVKELIAGGSTSVPSAEALRESARRGETRLCGWQEDGRLVGLVSVSPDGTSLRLQRIGLPEAEGRQGRGTAMVVALTALAKGASSLVAEADETPSGSSGARASRSARSRDDGPRGEAIELAVDTAGLHFFDVETGSAVVA